MPNILSIDNLTQNWGDITLFENISFGLSEGDKAALIARNGAGKTTLLNVIAGLQSPDSGEVTVRKEIVTVYLEQEPDFGESKTVIDALFSGDSEIVQVVKAYEAALEENNQDELNKLIVKIDALQAWDYETRVKQVLSMLKVEKYNQPISELSGGEKKRVALAAALIQEPDFLILDEPTNHLDMDMVLWLENFLSRNKATLLMVTHDRYFLDRVCNVIYELDDGAIYKYEGNYSYYLEKREERIELRNIEIEKARNLLRKEQVWMDRMPQARGTKAKYRIDAYYDLKNVAQQSIKHQELALEVDSARLGSKVLDLYDVNKSFDEKVLIKEFSHKFVKGDKIAIIGKNGAGKSTLLNILTGDLKPDSGEIEQGETVVFGYYKQTGMNISDDKKVIDVISEISEHIDTGNGRKMNAAQFLRYFLFPNEMHYVYVNKLSGGEKKRLYLMTVLMKNPNFLILDEPTNDLDIFTLNVLEDYLLNFSGCVLIVSHDRFFVDRVVDELFVFEGEGIIKNFPGNFSGYLEFEKEKQAEIAKEERKQEEKVKERPTRERVRKITFKEKKELEELEVKLEQSEELKTELETALNSGTLEGEELLKKSTQLGELMDKIDEMEMRWLELSELSQ